MKECKTPWNSTTQVVCVLSVFCAFIHKPLKRSQSSYTPTSILCRWPSNFVGHAQSLFDERWLFEAGYRRGGEANSWQ